MFSLKMQHLPDSILKILGHDLQKMGRENKDFF